METTCVTVKRTAIKLVRATMEEIQYFLLKNKEITHNIKILHLLRDPRGRLSSFWKINGRRNVSDRLSDITGKVCQRTMKDVMIRKQEAKGLKADRNFHIRYPHFYQINQYQ